MTVTTRTSKEDMQCPLARPKFHRFSSISRSHNVSKDQLIRWIMEYDSGGRGQMELFIHLVRHARHAPRLVFPSALQMGWLEIPIYFAQKQRQYDTSYTRKCNKRFSFPPTV